MDVVAGMHSENLKKSTVRKCTKSKILSYLETGEVIKPWLQTTTALFSQINVEKLNSASIFFHEAIKAQLKYY